VLWVSLLTLSKFSLLDFGAVPWYDFGAVPLYDFGGVPWYDFGAVPLYDFGGVPWYMIFVFITYRRKCRLWQICFHWLMYIIYVSDIKARFLFIQKIGISKWVHGFSCKVT
jgi:hypothetical protein